VTQLLANAAASVERRAALPTDRRKRSRSGRRGSDPREGQRRGLRVALVFVAYLLYVGARRLTTIFRRLRRA